MASKKNTFFSGENFNLLYEILKTDIQQKFTVNIDEHQEYRQILFSNMELSYNSNKEDTLKNINMKVIQKTGFLIYQKIKEKKDTHNELPIRDISLGKKVPEYNNMRPTFTQKETSIDETFEKINLERQDIEKIETPTIDFTLPMTTSNDKNPIELFDKRNNEYGDEGITSISEIQRRIHLDNEIRNENDKKDTPAQEIYKIDETKKEEFETFISKPVELIDFNDEKGLKTNSKIKKNYIEIESIDRLLEHNNHNRYFFKVSFSPAFKQFKRLPLFENNPTIRATTEESQRGERGSNNITGWMDSNGYEYKSFNPSKPYGNIVSYEDILMSGTNNLYIENNFKNIIEIKILSLILPYEYILHAGDNNPSNEKDIVALREPYILVQIDEIDGIYHSTSEIIEHSFCKMICFNEWNSDPRDTCDKNQYHGNIHFVPSIKDVSKKYYPSPLASLNSFTIKILKPNGEPIHTSCDNSDIRFIKYKTPKLFQESNYRHLMIKLNVYVETTIFKTYSNIIIKQYKLPLDISICPSKDNFEKFINRPEGHTIISTSNEKDINKDGYINVIYISSEGYFDTIQGEYIIEEYKGIDNLVSNLEQNSIIYNDTYLGNSSPFGSLFNMSYQSHISFEITTLEGDAEELNVRLI